MENYTDYVDIGDIIRIIRKSKGYSNNLLADFAGVSRATLRRIERTGKGNIDNVEKILSVLGYELEVVPING